MPTNVDDDSLDDGCLIIELITVRNSPFIYTFKKNVRVTIGKCEFCNNKRILKTECICKRVKYCNDRCLEKDKTFHVGSCSARADEELKVSRGGFIRKNNAKDGKVGLINLGNTCYMNSSI
jgi:ubiquitin C-terminal hydrolase